MKVVQINGGVFGSTGKIMFGISDVLRKYGHNALCFSPVTATNRDKEPDEEYIKIGSYNSRRVNVLLSRITGYDGCFSYFTTKRMLKRITAYNPDIIHLHNILSGYINLPMLFNYIKKNDIKTVWTLHDCWAFTGHCPHFLEVGCDKWLTECRDCPLYKDYPQSLFDNSKKMHKLKKKWFTGIPKCLIVTPSRWLAGVVKQSFLKQYPVSVINNGIDLSVFRPFESDFAKKHGLKGKFIVLGVSFAWSKKKGVDIFVDLARELPDRFAIVLVGVDDAERWHIPNNITIIQRTQNQLELAEIYSAADVLINPTREDNFPTVNIESLACGTPVITFDTGGSAEIIDESSGLSVPSGDTEALKKALLKIESENCFCSADCVKRAAGFNSRDKFEEYLSIYFSTRG